MNSFIHDLDQTNFKGYKPKDAKAALLQTEKIARDEISNLIDQSTKDRNYQNTIQAFFDVGRDFSRVSSTINHLQLVLGKNWQDADKLASELSAKLYSDIMSDQRLYKAIKNAKENDHKNWSHYQKKLVSKVLSDYEKSGILLTKDKRSKLAGIWQDLSKLSTQYAQLVNNQDSHAGLHIKNKKELAGLNQEFIETARLAADEKGLEGYWVQYSGPNLVEFMTNAESIDIRQKFHKMTMLKNDTENEALASEILAKRAELASMLGYKNFADYNLEDRMVKNGKTANNFLVNLRHKYSQKAFEEFEELQEFARSYTGDPSFELPSFETFPGIDMYFATKHKKQLFDLDENQVKEYFPVDQVIEGMFEVLTKLYSVSFKRIKTDNVWHSDVEVYEIINDDNQMIARVWCDWYARKGKQAGAWMNDIYVADRSKGVKKPHLGYVVANLPQPTKSQPSLLSIRDVETVWHEFGHFMHLAFSSTELVEHSMMNVKWDFVEAPSQIMENFIWEKEVLARFAKHYKTKEPLPEELLGKIIGSKRYRVASKALRQFCLAEADMRLHTSYNPDSDGSIVQVWRSVVNEIMPIKTTEYDKYILSFLHIFAGGYAAGYYSYKWAEAIQADMYSKFKQNGVISPEVGAEYRDTILANGAQEDPEILIEKFLGRQYSDKAILQEDGLI